MQFTYVESQLQTTRTKMGGELSVVILDKVYEACDSEEELVCKCGGSVWCREGWQRKKVNGNTVEAHIPLRDRKVRAVSNSRTRKQLLGYQL